MPIAPPAALSGPYAALWSRLAPEIQRQTTIDLEGRGMLNSGEGQAEFNRGIAGLNDFLLNQQNSSAQTRSLQEQALDQQRKVYQDQIDFKDIQDQFGHLKGTINAYDRAVENASLIGREGDLLKKYGLGSTPPAAQKASFQSTLSEMPLRHSISAQESELDKSLSEKIKSGEISPETAKSIMENWKSYSSEAAAANVSQWNTESGDLIENMNLPSMTIAKPPPWAGAKPGDIWTKSGGIGMTPEEKAALAQRELNDLQAEIPSDQFQKEGLSEIFPQTFQAVYPQGEPYSVQSLPGGAVVTSPFNNPNPNLQPTSGPPAPGRTRGIANLR